MPEIRLRRKAGTESLVAEPAVAAPGFYFGKPAANWIKHEHHAKPNQKNPWKPKAIVGRNGNRLTRKWIVKEPVRPAIADQRHDNRKGVNERKVQQIIEERHAPKYKDWPQQM